MTLSFIRKIPLFIHVKKFYIKRDLISILREQFSTSALHSATKDTNCNMSFGVDGGEQKEIVFENLKHHKRSKVVNDRL